MKIEITSLRVVGCGPLQDVRIDLTDRENKSLPVVLLAGANGSGKTTALEVMFGLFQLLDPEIRQVPPVLRRTQYAILNCLVDDIPFTIHYGSIEKAKKDPVAEENIGNSRSYESPPNAVTRRFRPSNISLPDGTKLAKNVQASIKNGRMFFSPFGELRTQVDSFGIAYAPSILYFPHHRAIESVEGQEVRRESTQYQWTHKYEVIKSFEGSFNSYLIWLDYAEPKTFQSIKAFLDTMYPDKKSFEINRRQLKAVVRTENGGVHDVDKLSSGEQNLLIMLLELRRRLLPGSIVLIDELENSLHRAFQHRLAQGLLHLQREIPFQLIVTTHAETFVDIFGTKATRILPVPSAVPAAEVK